MSSKPRKSRATRGKTRSQRAQRGKGRSPAKAIVSKSLRNSVAKSSADPQHAKSQRTQAPSGRSRPNRNANKNRLSPDPLAAFIDAAAAALDLPMDPSWRSAISANLKVTLQFGAAVAEFALPDDAESAPIFEA